VVVLPLVPLPALALEVHAGLVGAGLAGAPRALAALLMATPVWAALPFLMGGGLGSFLHLVLTAPERFAALEAGHHAPIEVRSMVASSLVVGAMFAAAGLVFAAAILAAR